MEDATSWKNHSFTFMIFGGIIVLCSIFFALGMLVGRGQGRQIAELAFEKGANKPSTSTVTDNLKLGFFTDSTAAKPDLTLQPQPEPPESVRLESATPNKLPAKEPAEDAKPVPPPVVPVTPPGESWVQVFVTKSRPQANGELKKVQLKGFKARIFSSKTDKGEVLKVLVGPYKQSELSLAKSDLRAKGYKDAFVPK